MEHNGSEQMVDAQLDIGQRLRNVNLYLTMPPAMPAYCRLFITALLTA